VVELCGDVYPELREQRQHVTSQLALEEERFGLTLDRGLRKLTKLLANRQELSGADAFSLYDTHGFPMELTIDLVRQRGGTLSPTFTEEFQAQMADQKRRSRTAAAGIFKGGLGDRSPEAVWFHTITHLTQAALRRVLGEHVHQRGSNITEERMRFDFSHPAKLTDDEKEQVEEFVNDAVARDLEVRSEQLPLRTALEIGALAEFGHKYGDVVTVYTITDSSGRIVSREICGGPHVRRTSEIRGEFKIVKEASVGAGVRRVTAVLNRT
jgi:alanyl-tRNA synthetase